MSYMASFGHSTEGTFSNQVEANFNMSLNPRSNHTPSANEASQTHAIPPDVSSIPSDTPVQFSKLEFPTPPPTETIVRRMDVDADDAALLQQPTHTLSREEKLRRRRLQYKLHQRRHRARQRQLTETLAHDVRVLTGEIAWLERERTRLQTRLMMTTPTRSLENGNAMQIAMAYLRQFENGLCRKETQERFLRSIMVVNVGGPDYQGIDELLYQWELYGQFFHRTQYIPDGVEVVSTGEDRTIVVVRVMLVIRARREGLMCLCPRIRDDETAIQALVGNAIHVPGVLRFVFDEHGACSWLGADMDFVVGLHRVLGDLGKVAMCMEDANLSFGTGQISPGCQFQLDGNDVGTRTSGVRV